jgi:hypothetical protein
MFIELVDKIAIHQFSGGRSLEERLVGWCAGEEWQV